MALSEHWQKNSLWLLLEKICFWIIYAISSLILIDSLHNQVFVFHILDHQGGKHEYVTINSLFSCPILYNIYSVYIDTICIFSVYLFHACGRYSADMLPFQSDWFSEQLVLERQQVALLFFSGFRIIDSHYQPGSCFSFY